jgi:peptide deformylase
LSGLASRCFQHELDHLNGITMYDRLKEQDAEQSRN